MHYTIIDMEKDPRCGQFAYFRAMQYPFASVTVEVDITDMMTARGVQQQLDQVHCLGVAHDAAVDKNSVAAEEAAHGTEGYVAVQVDVVVVGELLHGRSLFL